MADISVTGMEVAIIVARAMNGVIGRGGGIPWSIPADMKHFKHLTTGDGRNAVIMGRRTWQSIGKPLAGRTTIVLTHQPSLQAKGEVGSIHAYGALTDRLVSSDVRIGEPVEPRTTAARKIAEIAMTGDVPLSFGEVLYSPSLDDALEMARRCSVHIAWIAGGEAVYRAVLPLCRRLCVTEVLARVEGDTYFPDFDKSLYTAEESPVQQGGVCDGQSVEYRFVTYTQRGES